MNLALLALLGFAAWTLLLMMTTVGVYRWSRVLSGRAAIASFSAVLPEGPPWYRRAMRAHANCVENLPVFGAIVVSATLAGSAGPLLGTLASMVFVARVGQSLVHVAFEQTNSVVALRFAFFFAQLLAMLVMTLSLLLQR